MSQGDGREGDPRFKEKPVNPQSAESAQPNPQGLSQSALQELRKAGYPKPEGVSWGDWVGPKKTNNRHEIIALYAATGKTNREIAQALDMTDSRMSLILQTTRMQALVATLRDKHYGKDVQKRFLDMLPKTVDVVESILHNRNEKGSVRLKAANEVLNRALGKPKETLEIKNETVREIFDILDGVRSGERKLNLTRPEPTPIDAEFTSSEASAIPGSAPDQEKTRIDSWVEQNIPSGEGIGKKEPS